MSSSPENLARMLLSYYTIHSIENPLIVNLVTEESDNEYLTELLTTIYLECHNIYISGQIALTQNEYSTCLSSVFISVGYMLNTEIVPRSKLLELIYYARIINNQVQLNQFHPYRIRDGILSIKQQEGLTIPMPDTLEKFYTEQKFLPNIIIVHDLEPNNDTVMLLRFRKININFSSRQDESDSENSETSETDEE